MFSLEENKKNIRAKMVEVTVFFFLFSIFQFYLIFEKDPNISFFLSKVNKLQVCFIIVNT